MQSITLVTLIFIILIFIPGHFLKRFYFSGKFTKQFTAGDFAERLVTSLFWGVVVQLFTFFVFSEFTKINLQKTGSTATEVLDKLSKYNFSFDNKVDSLFCLFYLGSSIVFSVLLGYLLHKLVVIFKIDVRVKALRFANEWHYFFTGHNLKANQKMMGKGKHEAVLLDLVTEKGDGTTRMYSGFLNNYSLTKDGELETISITAAQRYNSKAEKFVNVPGDCLLIPYKKVININMQFVAKKKQPYTFSGRYSIIKNTAIALFVFTVIGLPVFMFIVYYGKLKFWLTILSIVIAELDLIFFGAIFSAGFAPNPSGQKASKITVVLNLVVLVLIFSWILKRILSGLWI